VETKRVQKKKAGDSQIAPEKGIKTIGVKTGRGKPLRQEGGGYAETADKGASQLMKKKGGGNEEL